MTFPCSLPMLASTMLLVADTGPASAQTYQPPADPKPHAPPLQLAVVQADFGFSIREKASSPTPTAAPMAIKVGKAVTLDGRLFTRTSAVDPEAAHVTQR